MANFLKVDKDLFKLNLNPIEILILAQINEFQTNTGDCFISNETLAKNFGVSEKTISRSLKNLEDRNFIIRNTKNIRGGKERHIEINQHQIKMYLTKDILSLDKKSTTDNLSIVQESICPLYNGQNDLIKDKQEEDKIKDNKVSYPEVELIQLNNMGCIYEKIDNDLVRIVDTGAIVRVK